MLGVEVGEEFEIASANIGPVRINAGGYIMHPDKRITEGTMLLSAIINHPERIIRKQKFTPDDIELLRHIRAVFGIGGLYRDDDGRLLFTDGNYTLGLPKNILHCIKCGDKMVELKQVPGECDGL